MRHRKRSLGNAELALAMELRTEGITWKLISYGLGVDPETLINRVSQVEREGMRIEHIPFTKISPRHKRLSALRIRQGK